MNIIAGVIILVLVVWIYVAVSYVHNKKMNCTDKEGCNGNCMSCSMHQTK